MLISGPKMTYFSHFRDTKNFPKKSKELAYFNTCHKVKFQKNLMIRFREKLRSFDFETKNDPFPQFWA